VSTRSNATVRDQSPFPEVGATPATWESCDVALGNKIRIEERVTTVFWNSAVASRTLTYTYDDAAGVERTKVVTLAAGAVIQVQWSEYLGRHAADPVEDGLAWFTASGSSGDVRMQSTRRWR
jgi:hypothetical protein